MNFDFIAGAGCAIFLLYLCAILTEVLRHKSMLEMSYYTGVPDVGYFEIGMCIAGLLMYIVGTFMAGAP